MTGAAPLYLLQLPFDGRRMYEFAAGQRLGSADAGYVMHALLAALFGSLAPRPFALPTGRHGRIGEDGAERLTVLAYARQPLLRLEQQARQTALPAVWQSVYWERAADKPMPDRFSSGMRLGFTVRACPVVRVGRGSRHLAAGADGPDGMQARGREVDAVTAARWAAADGRASGPVDRAAVYRDWLAEQFRRFGAAAVDGSEISACRRILLFRRAAPAQRPGGGDGRPSAQIGRSDVAFRGSLTVRDPGRFADWLARGVGRHRAFGFGMVLLHPL